DDNRDRAAPSIDVGCAACGCHGWHSCGSAGARGPRRLATILRGVPLSTVWEPSSAAAGQALPRTARADFTHRVDGLGERRDGDDPQPAGDLAELAAIRLRHEEPLGPRIPRPE